MDELLPPALRDSPLLMKPLMRLFAGKKARILYDFKSRMTGASESDYADLYNKLCAGKGQETMRRETDLNRQCVERILQDAQGASVLDAGCGGGFLTEKLAKKISRTVGLDIRTDIGQGCSQRQADYKNGGLESIPFEKDSFDCVICSHTIEHVLDLPRVMSELRRVARRQLIVVTPKQRPYYATFDTHLHFFPYSHSLLTAISAPQNHTLEIIGGDFYYTETMRDGDN